MKTHLTIEGMTCSSCKFLIEDICQEIPHVNSCDVDIKNGRAEIDHGPGVTGDEIAKAVNGIGKYLVTEVTTE